MSVKRTYSSKRNREPAFPPSSPAPSPSSSPPPPVSTKRSLSSKENRPTKRAKTAATKKGTPPAQKKLTQLHFCIDNPIVRQCPICEFTYTKGAEQDENLHRTQCARVQKSLDWGRDEAREADAAGVEQVASHVVLKDGTKGKIICMRAAATGKIGTKVSGIMEVVNCTVSAPPLSSDVLRESKIYLFLLPTSNKLKHTVAGCVVAQRIDTAMAVAAADSKGDLVTIDTGLFCHPAPIPTPLGIARLFVVKVHRRKGIAAKMLDAVVKTFVQGCVLDPRKGQVAFTQTTGDGLAVMRSWGGQNVRIYEE